MTSAESRERRDLTVPLLYWAIVLAGLASLALVRTSADARMLIPMWGGTIAGTAFGQIVARLRIRAWVLLVVLFPIIWFGGYVFLAVEALLRSGGANIAFEAFLPAMLGGYFSLSNRGALSALWFPSVAWMLALLDGAGNGLGSQACAAIACTFGVLFLAFMRARETRRVALWRTEAATRLATGVSETVLARAPARIFSQATWFAGMGATALCVSAWVLPHLLHDEHGLGGNAKTGAAQGKGGTEGSDAVCCDSLTPHYAAAQASKPIEYFPTTSWTGGGESSSGLSSTAPPVAHSCTACVELTAEKASGAAGTNYGSYGVGTTQAVNDGVGSGPYVPGSYVPGSYVADPNVATATNTNANTNAATASPATPIPPLESAPLVHGGPAPQKPHPTQIAPATAAQPHPQVAAPESASLPAMSSPQVASASPTLAPPPVPALSAPSSSIRGPSAFLTLAALAVALHAFGRIARRAIVVRHLTRALWPESAAQRLSNHWQLLLIGLRDAGWEPLPNEQPHALARRVGIEEVSTCATLLERARHGLRIESDDLTAMQSAAQSVYRKARATAGWSARTLSWLRPI